MSPVIFRVPVIEPIQALSSASGDAGTTSASGIPRRVTRNGIFVLFTSSNKDRHFSLNSEIAISCIDLPFLPATLDFLLIFNDLRKLPWSIELVNGRNARRLPAWRFSNVTMACCEMCANLAAHDSIPQYRNLVYIDELP